MTIAITHHDIELTPAIRQYIEEKMEGLLTYLDSIRHIDVVIGKDNSFAFFCRVNVQVGSRVFHLERSENDVYKAVDKVRDHLRVELSDWKKKMNGRDAGEGSEGEM